MEYISKEDITDILFKMADLRLEKNQSKYNAVLGVISDIADIALVKAKAVIELMEKASE